MNTFWLQWLDYWQAGGAVMPPLALSTLVLWYAIGARAWLLRRGSYRSVRDLLHRYRHGIQRPTGVLKQAIHIGQQVMRQGRPDPRRRLDDALGELERQIQRYGRVINAVVVSAPLLGLLGTVSGMIETFDSLAEMALFTQSGGIAGGISQALFTTQTGLAVAIPGLMIKGVLDRKEQRLRMELDQLKDLLLSQYHTGGTFHAMP